jgi:hypothetical protein
MKSAIAFPNSQSIEGLTNYPLHNLDKLMIKKSLFTVLGRNVNKPTDERKQDVTADIHLRQGANDHKLSSALHRRS